MTRRDHALLTVLLGAGFALTLFQCWYVYLPPTRAAEVSFCIFSEELNCFESLNRHGASLNVLGMPVFPALAGVFFFQLALCGFAWTVAGAMREAWLGIARLAAFPAAGLAIYVLLSDYLVAKTTSASAILVALIFLAIAVLAILQGLQGARLRAGGRWTAVLALAAVLFGFFLYGAGSSRRNIARVLLERETQRPDVLWADFAAFVPRAGFATLGNPLAETEVLLFVDLNQEASRALVRDALEIVPEANAQICLRIYGGADLILAQQRGRLRHYLRDLAPPPGDAASIAYLLERQTRAQRQLRVTELPTAVWKDGRRSGAFALRDVLAAATRQ
ncbi:MAG: hypothetical protein ACYTG3_09290 [Planctomycetota bacterium]|jgi:hypothetical protein